jgi:Ras homolog gene family, member A
VELSLCDTSCGDDYERLRPLIYPKTHVFLVCFAVDSPFSLERTKEKVCYRRVLCPTAQRTNLCDLWLLQWCGEIAHYCPEVPIILVACKKDLRDDEAVIEDLAKMGQHPLSLEEV